jgi:hypothetical protein
LPSSTTTSTRPGRISACVQPLEVVGGQHDDAAFLRPHAIQRVEQAAEAHLDARVLLVAGDEEGVDVLDQDQRARRRVLQQIGHASGR